MAMALFYTCRAQDIGQLHLVAIYMFGDTMNRESVLDIRESTSYSVAIQHIIYNACTVHWQYSACTR